MSTTISSWGNSEAIRMPKEMLRQVGLRQGDVVDFEINERGHLEIVPKKTYREGVRRRRLTFNDLFKGYSGKPLNNEDAWGDESFIGAEKDAWLS